MNREQLARLDDVIAHLKEHPERHYQGIWMRYEGKTAPMVTPELSCGTAFCIAGALVARAGASPEWEIGRLTNNDNEVSWVWIAENVYRPDGTHTSIKSYAMDLLGINWGEAYELFDGLNTMRDIEIVRSRLVKNYELTDGAEYGLNEHGEPVDW